MNTFSALLKKYITESGLTVYRLSQLSGVNRTTIQKSITSGRVPQKEAFQKILSALNLTRAERRSLMEAYEIASDGEYRYRQRRYIKFFLEQAALTAAPSASGLAADGLFPPSLCPKGRTLIQGHFELEDTLRLLLFDEIHNSASPSVSIFLPMDNVVFERFFSAMNHCQGLMVEQLLYLVKNPSAFENVNLHNLMVLSQMLPFLMTTEADYHVYYSYNDFAPVPEATTGFPYYILFSGYALLFSPDLDAAWLEDNEQLLAFLRKRFRLITRQSSVLNGFIKEVNSYLSKSTLIYANTNFNYSIEYQPCFLPFMDEKLTDALLTPLVPGREQLKALLAENRVQFHALKRNIILFTGKGLEEFSKNGIITNVPQGYARACTPSERLFLLRRIDEACESEQITMLCLNPSRFTLEKQLYLSLQQNGEVSFFSYNTDKNEFHFTSIQENTIYDAFYDFIEYLSDSDYVFTKEKTLEIIRACISSLECKDMLY